MADAALRCILFCEDAGHERFATEMIRVIAGEVGVTVRVLPRSARGGLGPAISSLTAFQAAAATGQLGSVGDLLVVLIDGNDRGWHATRSDVAARIDSRVFANVVIGSPDPHVEAWCFADPAAFEGVVGRPPPNKATLRSRISYKAALSEALLSSGRPILGDPMDYAGEFIAKMDIYRAGKNAPSFKNFVDDLRAAIVRLKGPR